MTLLPGFNQEIVGFERDQKARQGLQRQKSGREDKKWSLAGCRGKRRLEGCLGGEICEELCGRAGEAAAHEGQALSWGEAPSMGPRHSASSLCVDREPSEAGSIPLGPIPRGSGREVIPNRGEPWEGGGCRTIRPHHVIYQSLSDTASRSSFEKLFATYVQLVATT